MNTPTDRKPIFDAIRYERDLPFQTSEITLVNNLLTYLGFPTIPTRPVTFIPMDKPPVRGLFRRSTVFSAIRVQTSILSTQGKATDAIAAIDVVLSQLGFPQTTSVSTPATPTTKPSTSTLSKLALLVGLPAAALLGLTLDRWEGNELVAYKDIVGVATNCRGNTKNVQMRRYTPQECDVINDAAAVEHAVPVLKATPILGSRDPKTGNLLYPNQLVAAISLAYNVGVNAYAKSSADYFFDNRSFTKACDRFLPWNKAGGKVVRGLTLRRQAERDLCLKDIPSSVR